MVLQLEFRSFVRSRPREEPSGHRNSSSSRNELQSTQESFNKLCGLRSVRDDGGSGVLGEGGAAWVAEIPVPPTVTHTRTTRSRVARHRAGGRVAPAPVPNGARRPALAVRVPRPPLPRLATGVCDVAARPAGWGRCDRDQLTRPNQPLHPTAAALPGAHIRV